MGGVLRRFAPQDDDFFPLVILTLNGVKWKNLLLTN